MARVLFQALYQCGTPLKTIRHLPNLPRLQRTLKTHSPSIFYRNIAPSGTQYPTCTHHHRGCTIIRCVATASSHPAPLISEDDAEAPHVPVLLEEIMGFFQESKVRVYVDGTLGAGGHASEVVRRHPELETLVGFDLDPTAHAIAGQRLQQAGATVVPVTVDRTGAPSLEVSQHDTTTSATKTPTALLVRSNFSALGRVLPQLPGGIYGSVDAILLDLGISSMQVDRSERGFSFLRDGPWDMRMDPGASLSAETLVNSWPEAQIGKILKEFGEERYWKSIARRIASAREEAPILTTQQLVKAIGNPGGGGRSKEKKHPATRTFQALRIAVNGELQSIAEAIPAAVGALAPGGRLAVITFHSLEDRIVKWAFRQAAGMAPTDEPLPSYCLPFDGALDEAHVKILTRRPVVPGKEEEAENPRSRSAKLRVVERLA